MAPGGNAAAVKTGVAPLKLFRITTLVSMMLPALLTVPLYVSKPSGLTGFVGQFCVTAICGVVRSGQVALTELFTATPQTLAALAASVSATEQLAGAV